MTGKFDMKESCTGFLVFRSEHKAAVLSLCMPEKDILVSACQDKKVRVLDLRSTSAVQMEYKQHRRSVASHHSTAGVL